MLIVAPETGEVESTIGGLISVDALTVAGDTVAALDRHQSSITELDLEDSKLRVALRAGDGATQMTSDPFGRVIVTDTDDDELLVHTLDSLVLRQRYPTGPAPYAVAYDEKRDLVWVTLTGSNEVVGYDLSTGIPRERHASRRCSNPTRSPSIRPMRRWWWHPRPATDYRGFRSKGSDGRRECEPVHPPPRGVGHQQRRLRVRAAEASEGSVADQCLAPARDLRRVPRLGIDPAAVVSGRSRRVLLRRRKTGHHIPEPTVR